MPSSVLGVLVGEVDLGGVVSLRFDGLDGPADAPAGLDGLGDLGRRRNIFFVSGSVRTEIGDICVGSRSGEKRAEREPALGVVGGVPSSVSGASSVGAAEALEEAREGLA